MTLHMTPDEGLEKKWLEEEKQRLERIKDKLTDADMDRVIKETKELKEFQVGTSHTSMDAPPRWCAPTCICVVFASWIRQQRTLLRCWRPSPR